MPIYLDSRSDRTQFSKPNLGPLATLADFFHARHQERATLQQARRSASGATYTTLIGSSPAIQDLLSLIERVATSPLPVLVFGESGTGKELVAREIHQQSARREQPFVALYCGNVSPQLFESELFGHKQGSFTGATSDKPGLVQAAAERTVPR